MAGPYPDSIDKSSGPDRQSLETRVNPCQNWPLARKALDTRRCGLFNTGCRFFLQTGSGYGKNKAKTVLRNSTFLRGT